MSALRHDPKNEIKTMYTVCDNCGAEYEYTWVKNNTVLSVYIPCPDCLQGRGIGMVRDNKDDK